jgi:hypothetical protein
MTPRSLSREGDVKEAMRECITHMAPYAMLDSSITSLKEFVEVNVLGNRAFMDVGRDLLRVYVIREQLRGSRTYEMRYGVVFEVPPIAAVSYHMASAMFALVMGYCGDWLEDYFSDNDYERLLPLYWTLADAENGTRYDFEMHKQTLIKLRGEAPLVLIGVLYHIGANSLVDRLQSSIYGFALAALERRARRGSSGGAGNEDSQSSSSSSSVVTGDDEAKAKRRSLRRRKHDKK